MANKLSKLFISTAALLAGVGVLAGCDDIEAKPEWTDADTIINVDGELTNNQMKVIYEALVKKGSSNSEKVLNNVLKALSKSYFGAFYSDETTGEIGIYDAVNNGKMDQFVAAHSIFKESFDKTEDDQAAGRVKMYYNHLIKKINKEFIGIAKNSSYQERNMFKEAEWVKAQIGLGYDVELPVSPAEVMVNGNDKETEANKYFHEGYIVDYKDFIERSVLPSLYENKLVEYFIMKVNPGVLGRTYARNIEFIKVADNADYPTAMRKLTSSYAENVIEAGLVDTYDFDFLSDLIKGIIDFNGDSDAEKMANKIYTDAEFDLVDAPSVTFVLDSENITYTAPLETTLGGYLKEFNKIKDNRFTNDLSAYNDFTGNGAYVKEIGLKIHYDTLVAKDTIKNDGWYTNSSLSGLPSDLKTRLFKQGLSTELDADSPKKVGSYGNFVAGKYYLTPESYEKTNAYPYIVYADSASYIVKVNEAISVSKLQADSESSYSRMAKHDDNKLFREEVAYEAAHLISDNETYTKNAKQYFIEKAALAFHDDYVYDYFADTFPDLFESNND